MRMRRKRRRKKRSKRRRRRERRRKRRRRRRRRKKKRKRKGERERGGSCRRKLGAGVKVALHFFVYINAKFIRTSTENLTENLIRFGNELKTSISLQH